MKKYILIIDDDMDFLDLIRDYCSKKNIEGELKFFVDALEAMGFMVKNKDSIQMVFTDYNMKNKGMSGTIIVEKCNELGMEVVVVTSDPQILLSKTSQFRVINKITSLSEIVSYIETSEIQQ